MGGAGSAVIESLASRGFSVPVLQLGLPDVFVDQGECSQMLADCGLDKTTIVESVRARFFE
jgi:1-deoxy-D-xylulose-5-phosphate synthase